MLLFDLMYMALVCDAGVLTDANANLLRFSALVRDLDIS
jgi:hypothetical protein